MKDSIPKCLKPYAVYKFVCLCCNACYIGEATRHLTARIKKHLETDKKSHIFAYFVNDKTFKAFNTENCFEIVDSPSTPFRLKLKEAMNIIYKRSSLNKQQKYVSISVNVYQFFVFTYYLYLTLSFHFIFSRVLLSSLTYPLTRVRGLQVSYQ